MDQLVAALAGVTVDRRFSFSKNLTPQAAGFFTALMTQPGQPGVGVTPSSGLAGDIPTDATAGAFPFTNPTAPVLSYIGGASCAASQVGTLYVYDRLWQNSGISSTLLTAQTINSIALTRPDANGIMAEAWWQVYATMGAGSPTVTLAYTNSANTGSRAASSTALVTTMVAGRTGPFTLQAGDTGVRSIQTWTSSATFTSGTIGLVLRRKLMTIPVSASDGGLVLDAIQGGMPTVPDDACIELLWLAGVTSAQWLFGTIVLAQG